MKITDVITEAANPAQQAAIAVAMKKAGKKPKSEDMAEGFDKQALQKELIIINKLIKVMKNSWQQQHLLQKKEELLKQLKQGVAESKELAEEFDLIESIVEQIAERNGVDAEAVWEDLESLTEDELYVFAVTSDPLMESEAWQKANKRDKTDGMSQKAVNTYRREHPGSKLKTAVTTKPSKLKKGSKASKRRSSYCSRSRGQMKMHSISCSKTPDKAICKARRRWNC
jgi:hypothetical protein